MSESVYQVVTDRILTLLAQGQIPWQKPWTGEGYAPQNLISRKPYRGVNTFLLNALHYSSPFWVSFKQAQALGGYVRKGEKSCPVVFWKWLDVKGTETGENERIPLLRYYSVFNVAQCDGLSVPTLITPSREHSPIKAAEQIVAGMPMRPEIRPSLAQAFYSPVGDFVGMPAAEQFKTAEDYYSVLFHELTHATGHESRLNRKGVTGSEGNWSAFGSNQYAREELVAEMGAAFLSGHVGIVERTLNNSAAYVASWLDRLRTDSKLIVQAGAAAQKAADFILNRSADYPAEAENERNNG